VRFGLDPEHRYSLRFGKQFFNLFVRRKDVCSPIHSSHFNGKNQKSKTSLIPFASPGTKVVRWVVVIKGIAAVTINFRIIDTKAATFDAGSVMNDIPETARNFSDRAACAAVIRSCDLRTLRHIPIR
jgi:hypothetical protein